MGKSLTRGERLVKCSLESGLIVPGSLPWFTLRSYGPISLSDLSQLPLILSAAVTLLGLYVVLAKDRELSLDAYI